MNIGPIIRGTLGKNGPAESKTLELRTGQVVRGSVLSISGDGTEAVVEVQGVKLKAALESPLQQGQSMMMQVQPPGKDGLIVLRPMPEGSMSGGQDKGLDQLLKGIGLANTPENRELVKLMQEAGMPVDKTQANALLQTLSGKPVELPLAEWVNAAAIALQRGLGLSKEIVSGLHQAIFGPPVHTLITELEGQLASLLETGAGSITIKDSSSAAKAVQLPTAESGSSLGSGQTAEAGTPAAAGRAAAAPSTAAPALEALLGKLQSILGELRVELARGQEGSRAAVPGAGTSAAAGQAAGSSAAAEGAAQEAAPLPQGGAAQAATSQGTESWLGRVLKLLGAEHEQQAGRALAFAAAPEEAAPADSAAPAPGAEASRPGANGSSAGAAAAGSSTSAGVPGATGHSGQSAPPSIGGAAVEQAGPGPQAGPAPEPDAADPAAHSTGLIPGANSKEANGGIQSQDAALPTRGSGEKVLAGSLGQQTFTGSTPDAEVPEAAQKLPENGFRPPVPAATGALLHELQEAAAHPASIKSAAVQENPANLSVKDSLKSVLLQILDTPDAPPQLQEAARQMVQQLTGQQLLLNTDRTAPFAQVTIFLPFGGTEGEETATVQIQSRRGKRGELDPDNCRLWFDLHMSALGKLMVDVQVADKKVILQIHSTDEGTGTFFEQREEEISSAIETAGYRLVALRTLSFPEGEEEQKQPVLQSGAVYAPPEYKGVDYRV